MNLLLLSLEDVKQSINMHQAIEAMESAFCQLAGKEVELPLRTGVSIEEKKGLMLSMPSYLKQNKALGLKVVSIFPENPSKNLPSITGFIMMLDAGTGEPKALMDAAWLTALRTGAVSGLATKYFANEQANHVAIIGSGVQAETQLEAVCAVRDIQQVSVWSRNIKNAERLAEKIAVDLTINVYENIADAVKDADVICTATASQEPLIFQSDLKPGVHINAVGSHSRSMHEIAADVLKKSIVFADQREAVLAESGEIFQAVESQQLNQEDIIEIGSWLQHKEQNYKMQQTVFKSVGLAIQDLSVAEAVFQNAMKNKAGIQFSLS